MSLFLFPGLGKRAIRIHFSSHQVKIIVAVMSKTFPRRPWSNLDWEALVISGVANLIHGNEMAMEIVFHLNSINNLNGYCTTWLRG